MSDLLGERSRIWFLDARTLHASFSNHQVLLCLGRSRVSRSISLLLLTIYTGGVTEGSLMPHCAEDRGPVTCGSLHYNDSACY